MTVPRRIARARDRRKNPTVLFPVRCEADKEQMDKAHVVLRRMGIRFNSIGWWSS